MTIPTTITKAQATGNDFVIYADPQGILEPTAEETRWLCDRHFGIGADGLLRLTHPQYVSDLDAALRRTCADAGASWFMDYRNADGSLAEMCGNGTRAITLFARRHDMIDERDAAFRLGTRAGVKTITATDRFAELGDDVFTVAMGRFHRGPIDAYRVTIPGTDGEERGTFVDMGNPHIVVPELTHVPSLQELDLTHTPIVEPALVHGQNVEFVHVDDIDITSDSGKASMRVNERGVGETLSCGTGLCASAVVLQGMTGVHHWSLAPRGGHVVVDVDDATSTVTLTGPAAIVGEMHIDPSGLPTRLSAK